MAPYTPEEYNEITSAVGDVGLQEFNKNKFMENGIFKLTKGNLKSAVVYGLVAVAVVIISEGTVFGLDWKVLTDVGILAVLTSVVKNLLTNNNGQFLSVIGVK